MKRVKRGGILLQRLGLPIRLRHHSDSDVFWSINEPQPHPSRVVRLLPFSAQTDPDNCLSDGTARIYFRTADSAVWTEATVPLRLSEAASALDNAGEWGLAPYELHGRGHTFDLASRVSELRSLGMCISTVTLGPLGSVYILHSLIVFDRPSEGCGVALLVDNIRPVLVAATKQEHNNRSDKLGRSRRSATTAALCYVSHAELDAVGLLPAMTARWSRHKKKPMSVPQTTAVSVPTTGPKEATP